MIRTVSIQNTPDLDWHAIAVGFGYLGAALGVAMVIPQIARTFRNRNLPGVSALTWALTSLSCGTWLLYGVRADEVPQIPGNALIVTGAVVIVLAVPSALSSTVRAVFLAVPALTLIGLATFLPPTAIGFIAFGIGLVSAVPQAFQALFRPRPDVSAMSVPAWVLRGASQVCWMFYAIVLGDVVVFISTTVILSSATLLVVTELRRREPVRPIRAHAEDACITGAIR